MYVPMMYVLNAREMTVPEAVLWLFVGAVAAVALFAVGCKVCDWISKKRGG
jgi:hypothetical protein